MPQILFVVEVPPNKAMTMTGEYPPAWSKFAGEARTILKSHKGSSTLQLNAWLLPADHAWPALERLTACATTLHLSYSVVLIPDGVIALTPPVKS